jgi:hypothetical protein
VGFPLFRFSLSPHLGGMGYALHFSFPRLLSPFVHLVFPFPWLNAPRVSTIWLQGSSQSQGILGRRSSCITGATVESTRLLESAIFPCLPTFRSLSLTLINSFSKITCFLRESILLLLLAPPLEISFIWKLTTSVELFYFPSLFHCDYWRCR